MTAAGGVTPRGPIRTRAAGRRGDPPRRGYGGLNTTTRWSAGASTASGTDCPSSTAADLAGHDDRAERRDSRDVRPRVAEPPGTETTVHIVISPFLILL